MDSQVKLYRGTVLTIMSSGRGEIPLQVEEQVCVCVCVRERVCVCESVVVTLSSAVFVASETTLG